MDVWTDYWNMYNEIFTLGRYPDPWKQAIVVPILKKNKPAKNPASYTDPYHYYKKQGKS